MWVEGNGVRSEPMRHVVLVANPSASGFTGGRFRAVMAALSERFSVTAAWPTSPSEARREAVGAAQSGAYAVIAMGGDGVAHHVANGLVHTSTALGLVPAGTTNVFAKILDIPAKPAAAAKAIGEYEPKPVTLAHVVAETVKGVSSAYALFALGVGFDADVVEAAERRPESKQSFGAAHFASTAVGMLVRRYRNMPANLRVECVGTRTDAVAVMVQIHQVYTYFGRIPLRLGPAPRRGLVACAIESVGAATGASIVARAVVSRSLSNAPGCTVFPELDKMLIDADPPSPLQADGELLGYGTAFEITPASGALLVLSP
jgi:diacylglycerol kinase family enzyme